MSTVFWSCLQCYLHCIIANQVLKECRLANELYYADTSEFSPKCSNELDEFQIKSCEKDLKSRLVLGKMGHLVTLSLLMMCYFLGASAVV